MLKSLEAQPKPTRTGTSATSVGNFAASEQQVQKGKGKGQAGLAQSFYPARTSAGQSQNLAKGKGQGKVVLAQAQAQTSAAQPRKPQGPKPVNSIQGHEWSQKPELTSLSLTRKALEQGTELPGNVTVVDDLQAASSIKDLWAAYQCQSPFTLCLIHHDGQKTTLEGLTREAVISVWRQGSPRHSMLRVTCEQLSASPGPLPKQAITTRIPTTSASPRVTVRLLAPLQYRQYVTAKRLTLRALSYLSGQSC